MLFSVVIPTFDRADFLPRTLASVWAQSCRDFEVVVVDDGSTDGTRAYLASLGDRVRVIHQLQQGPGAARNAGVAVASGDYIAFLDSDDLWFPWTLATFARIIADVDPSFLAGSVLHFTDDPELGGYREGVRQFRLFSDYLDSAASAIAVGSGTAAFKRSVLLASGGFTHLQINAEDHDLALRLGELPRFVWIESPLTVGWRRHAGSVTAIVERGIAGTRHLISQERAGRYPGGDARAAARHEIITRHVRPISFECLREAHFRAARDFYVETLRWHWAARRWRYLGGFPLAWAWAAVRRRGQS